MRVNSAVFGRRLAIILLLVLIVLIANFSLSRTKASAAAQPPQFAHAFIVLEENYGYSDVIGSSAMPYLNSLAAQYGLATNYYANTHPSIGNYFMLTTGQIITNDDNFAGTVTDDNIIRELLTAGKSWKSYAQSLPSVGYTGGDIYPYSKHHNPAAYISDVINNPAQANNLVPFTQFATDVQNNTLPDYSFIVPDKQNDAHDCPAGLSTCTDTDKLAAADNWLKTNIAPLISSAAFQQSGLLVIAFDEARDTDTTNGGGHIATVIISSKSNPGFQSTTLYQHQSTLRLFCEALGLTAFPGAAATAPDMTEFFNTSSTPPPSEIVLLADDFNSTTLDTTKWSLNNMFSGTTDSTVAVKAVNQRVEVGPLLAGVSGSHYNGLRSASRYDFTGAYAYTQVPQVTSSSTAADVMLTLGNDVNDYYRIYVEAGQLIVQKKVAGVKTNMLTTTYNAASQAFWRIRHDSSSSSVVFEVASNNGGSPGAWSQIYSEAWNTTQIPVTGILFELKAGTWQPETSPGTAAFDNFRAAKPVANQLGPAPTVSAVSPNGGSTNGGTAVTITGTNFASGAMVSIGNTPATSVTIVNSTTITATTPAHLSGTVNIVVTNPDAQAGTLVNGFTYVASTETVLLADDFSTTSVDTSKWATGNLFSGFTDTNIAMNQSGQSLHIGPLPQGTSGSHYNGIRSATQYNFTGAYAYVQASQVVSSATAADVMFTLGNDVNNYYRIYYEAGNLIVQKRINNLKATMLTIGFNPTNHAFWRIRHNSSANSVVFETAPNSGGAPGAWTSVYTEPWSSNVNLASIQFELKAGTWQAETSAPGTAIFDNFRAAKP